MPIPCMEFLTKKRRGEPPRVVVIFGDDEFLQRRALLAVRDWVVGPEPDDFVYSEHIGPEAKLRDVLDELFTSPFLGDVRLVVVLDADKFVTAHRDRLLEYAENPSDLAILLLEARSWSASTKLAKAVEASGLAIECKSPQAWHTGGWCSKWAQARYEKTMDKQTGDWLVELVGPTLGLLDQEIAKLASFVGDRPAITIDDVQKVVAGTRAESVFKLLDLTLEGKLREALLHLDRQLTAGETPVGILAMLTAQLRKLTRAARERVAGKSMESALKEAGVPVFAIDKSAAQLAHLGRPRMAAMYRRLLEADLDLKGGSDLPNRTILERFLVELARPK